MPLVSSDCATLTSRLDLFLIWIRHDDEAAVAAADAIAVTASNQLLQLLIRSLLRAFPRQICSQCQFVCVSECVTD